MCVAVVVGVHVKDFHVAIERGSAQSVVELVGTAPFAKDVDHLVLTRHRWLPRLRNPTEHASDGSCGSTRGIVGGTHPRLAEAVHVKLAVVAGRRPDERPFVVVHQGVYMAIVEIAHIPTRCGAVVAVVANACACIEILAHHGGIGAHAHAEIVSRNLDVGVMYQGVADVFNVHVIRLPAVVAAARAFGGAYADAFVEPIDGGRHVALVIQHLGDLILHIGHALSGKSSYKDFGIVVVAFQLAKPNVGASARHGFGREVAVVADQKHMAKVLFWVVVMAENERLNHVSVVAANFRKADHRGRSARLVFPIHKGLHSLQILVRADDQ